VCHVLPSSVKQPADETNKLCRGGRRCTFVLLRHFVLDIVINNFDFASILLPCPSRSIVTQFASEQL
jgi:hypothetical protein